jgi:hypothetical protein
MLLVVLSIMVALAAAGYARAEGSRAIAGGLSRVAAMVSGFVEFKAALRNARTAGARRSGGGRLAYRASFSQGR